MRIPPFTTLLLALCLAALPAQAKNRATQPVAPNDDEFVGPFASWADLKRDFGAVGDGQADDTAALQKALDALKADNKPKVLYLPAGTYLITQGLQMISHFGVSVLGEDPAATKIKWDGAAGGTMLLCNGARYGRFGRITWDGAGKAGTAIAHQWDSHTLGANSHNEHADEVFQDVGFGIRAGVPHFMDAECPVLRCRFVRCSQAGLSIESFNALDWWVWNSVFEDCRVGVTNDPGAGHFHVYHSLFRRSSEADIKMSNCSYFGIRHNTSIGSKTFFLAGWRDCAGAVTMQGNTVLDPTGTAIQMGNYGPFLLLDNVIRSRAGLQKGEHIVQVNLAETTLAAGNTFPVAGAIEVATKKPGAQITNIGNTVLSPAAMKVALPWLPGALPNRRRKVFEIAAGADAKVIQAAIDAAARLRGQRAVVHLPVGAYKLDQTLVIPANSGVQLAGDGYLTQLKWAGQGRGPVLRLAGPSRAVLRDLEIQGGGSADGIIVEKCDQPGARVWMEQGEVQNDRECGLFVDGLDFAQVDLHDFYHSGSKGVAVKVSGGPRLAAGAKVPGRVAIFGGASSNNELSYDVLRGGQIVAEDIWYEGAPPRFVHLNGAKTGRFTLNGAVVATGRPGPNTAAGDPNFAAFQVDDFRGDVAILNATIHEKLVLAGAGAATNLFAMTHGSEGFFQNRAPRAKAALWGSTQFTPGGGAIPIANQGQADARFILQMLAPLRGARAQPLVALRPDLSDVRFLRVSVSDCLINVHLKAN